MSAPVAPATPAPAIPWGAIVPKLAYGLRVSGAVALALFVAFYLELDNPSWAGTSACIVCQPVLGSSLRKGLFRAVGTLVGAAVSVVLTGIFPQNRVGFLFGMALWAALCSFGNTLTRNFAAYAFALSGYTLAIIAGDSISNPGDVFTIAITRASEIVIGIVCGTLVMSLSDLGTSPARLAARIDEIGRDIMVHFSALLEAAGGQLPLGAPARRALIAEVAGLDPLIDQAIGEAPELRHRKPILQAAMGGLFGALSGWRIVETHLRSIPPEDARREAAVLTDRLPDAWRWAEAAGDAFEPGSDKAAARRRDLAAVRALASLDADGVTQRLLADATAGVALGLSGAANALSLIRHPAVARDPGRRPGFAVADYLPAVVNAIRVFVSVSAAILFWIATEWPSGLGALTFMAVTVLLLSPQQEKSGPAALGFGIGTAGTAVLAAIVNFAALPNHEGFLSLALIVGAVLTPLAALSTVPALAPYLVAATMNFVPLLGPTNVMTFNTVSFYNGALGIVGGCGAAALALVVMPPVPARFRAVRLVELTLRDLRTMARGRWHPTAEAWQNRVYMRLIALPPKVDDVHGARLVAALSVGLQVIRLRSLVPRGPIGHELQAALQALARSDLPALRAGLDRIDAAVAAPGDGEAGETIPQGRDADPDGMELAQSIVRRRALRIRTATQVIRDTMRRHAVDYGSAGR